jgi:CubicO group peptidase (beta-lactamase class C family)
MTAPSSSSSSCKYENLVALILGFFCFTVLAPATVTCGNTASAATVKEPALTQTSLKAAADYSFSTAGQTFLVMQDGKILAEQYAAGGDVNRRQMLASGSKSFVGIAAAAAVQDKLIRLDDFVSEAIPEWKTDPLKSRITYRQLLSLTSGLTAGEPRRALRAPGWGAIAAKPMTSGAGEKFNYGAYHLNCFAYALERRLNHESFEDYLKRRVLNPLGITLEWRVRCEDGHPQVGGGGFMTARDWSTFGAFIADNGNVGSKSIIDPQCLAQCFIGSSQNPDYGLTWWLKRPVSASICRSVPILSRVWGAVGNAGWVPSDMVAALGAGNQRLYVVPSMKLVVVRQAGFVGRRGALGAGRLRAQRSAPDEPDSSQSEVESPDEASGRSFSDVEFLSRLFRNPN